MGCLQNSLLPPILLVTCLSFLVESKTHWGDVSALKELKNSLDSNSLTPGSCLSSWDFSVDPCDNLFSEKFTCGFRCDTTVSKLSRVTELTLDQAGYSASLTSLSWNLPYLQTLDLSNNNFYGKIPDSISNLTRLTRLGFSRNWFAGEIPYSVGSLTNLEELYLDNNILEGSIPPSLNSLFSLKRLELQSNKLFGKFPKLNSLKNLIFLDVSDNNLSSEVPELLPLSLVQISMRNNTLQGSIPGTLKNMPFLQVLDLSHNNLSGFVPLFLFDHPSLQQLTLSYNHFKSVQSPIGLNSYTLSIESQLIALDLSNNELQSFLPWFFGLLPKLSALSLENNKFTGMIPTQYAIKVVLPGNGVSPFSRLLLGGNYLFGLIPELFMGLKPDSSVNVTLNDNCFHSCPLIFFFCQGGDQKSLSECQSFNPVIP